MPQRAALLGYVDHATYQLEDESAGSPAAVKHMLTQLVPAALARAREDARDLQQLVEAHARDEDFEPFRLAAWDWAFYAERLRKARFDFDRAQVAPYLSSTACAAGRRVLFRARIVRSNLQGAPGTARLPSGRAGFRGV
ncbi:MAG: M3 family metallopeptidase [Steroidobacteraceae bacterium]